MSALHDVSDLVHGVLERLDYFLLVLSQCGQQRLPHLQSAVVAAAAGHAPLPLLNGHSALADDDAEPGRRPGVDPGEPRGAFLTDDLAALLERLSNTPPLFLVALRERTLELTQPSDSDGLLGYVVPLVIDWPAIGLNSTDVMFASPTDPFSGLYVYGATIAVYDGFVADTADVVGLIIIVPPELEPSSGLIVWSTFAESKSA